MGFLRVTSQSLVVNKSHQPNFHHPDSQPKFTSRHAPLVGASIAVHPPKFYAVSRFLEQWFECPAAVAAMSLHIVFSDERDLKIFREVHSKVRHRVPDKAWRAVVANVPLDLQIEATETIQNLAAWKKWYGIAHLLDLGVDAPVYGLMLDSEILLYNISDCGPHSTWSKLFDRLSAAEASRKIPAARVSNTMKFMDEAKTLSGKISGQGIINDNMRFVMHGQSLDACSSAPCQRVRRMRDLCLFSWWTDIPFMNLTIAGDLIASVSAERPKLGRDWRAISRPVRFPHFEMISYHVWCVLHEGYDVWDVTEITKETGWGSFLEDPQPGSRLAELEPMWIASESLLLARHGLILQLSRKNPPLLVFHIDHQERSFPDAGAKQKWEQIANVVIAAAKLRDRQDLAKRIAESGIRVGYSCENCKCGIAMPMCCPLGTFAYHDGSHCCKNKVDIEGKPIALHSQSCMEHKFILCPGKQKGCVTCSVINLASVFFSQGFKEQAPKAGQDARGRIVCSAAKKSCNCLHPEFDLDSGLAEAVWKI